MLAETFISFLIFVTVADTRWTGSITKDRNSITNNSQILPAHSKKRLQSSLEDFTNNVDELKHKEEQYIKRDGQLLVGFGGNPFKDSIPATDYWKGIRAINLDSQSNKSENRNKRGIPELRSIIKCGSGCDASDYVSYGCYCGFGGFGTPVDGIDECCQQHDHCYDSVHIAYTSSYYWYCDSDGPYCSYYRNDDNSFRICQCDRDFSKCLNRYYCPSYNAKCNCSPFCWLHKDFWF